MIKKSLEKDGNLLPSIINVTESIPNSILNSGKYQLRHPKTIAYRSLDRVFKAFKSVINEYQVINNEIALNKKFVNSKGDSRTGNLSDFIIELFESIISYIENCQHIFKATTPYQLINETFVNKWLKKAKHPTYLNFYNSIKDYRDEISCYVNTYKHEHGKIDIIGGFHAKGSFLGYTMTEIEYSDLNEVNEVLDLNKIKSIIPDLLFHFHQVYLISEVFTSELIDSIKTLHNIDIQIQKNKSEINNFNSIVNNIIKTEYNVFPGKEIFSPKYMVKHDLKTLTIKGPLGFTDNNKRFVKAFKIKGKKYPENRVFLIPTEKTLKEMKLMKKGMKMELIDTPDNFFRIFCCAEISENDKNKFNEIELNFNNMFKVKSSSKTTCAITLKGGIVSEKMKINIFKTDDIE